MLEEAKKRDHRKLGKELDLFSFHPQSPASPFFHARGTLIYNGLIEYTRGLYKTYDYDEVVTPQIFDASLWKTSGHYSHYKDNMYFTEVDGREFGVKPMNCPSHCLLFSEKRYSYRDLPIRLGLRATPSLRTFRSHRRVDPGAELRPGRRSHLLHAGSGSRRSPEHHPDDLGHIRVVRLRSEDLPVHPSGRSGGDDKLWDRAESDLAAALDAAGHAYQVNPGDGAFYGPKIDFVVRDALRREHQLGTIQLDYVLPERFDLRFIDAEDQEQRPVMVHRAMLGSLERFIGILLEHVGGAIPFWLAPEQVRVLSITDRTAPNAAEVAEKLKKNGFRASADVRNEKIGAKIREAQLMKIPIMLVIGDREAESGQVAVRDRVEGDRGAHDLSRFIEQAREWVGTRSMQTAWEESGS